MIKFGFECVDNDKPTEGLFLQFRAYLTAGITDNHQAAYNTFKYMGRGEDFFIYQGFTRTINFSFRVAVENHQDLTNLYKKLNALASQVYPDYSKGGIMRTSLTRVTVGDYIYRMPGFIESVSITVNQDSSWEINEGNQVPHYLDVAISFKPIHDKIPERVKLTNLGQPNSILHNRADDYQNSPLNQDFYLSQVGVLTQVEQTRRRRSEERDKRRNKKAEAEMIEYIRSMI